MIWDLGEIVKYVSEIVPGDLLWMDGGLQVVMAIKRGKASITGVTFTSGQTMYLSEHALLTTYDATGANSLGT